MTSRPVTCARPPRRGAAVAEFALCLPVVVFLVFAPIELCDMLHRRTGLSIAAYEGARRAIRAGATSADVVQTCRDLLDARGLKTATVRVGPYEVADAPVGTPIIVTVTLPPGGPGSITGIFLRDQQLTAKAVMVKEWK
jgi:Flp pilus assembly protein TadG